MHSASARSARRPRGCGPPPPRRTTSRSRSTGTCSRSAAPTTSAAPNAHFGAGRSGHSHQGQDVFAKCGTPLVAARAGKVKFSGFHAAAGYYVVINGKGTGVDYAYMHLRQRAAVQVGDSVYTGQDLGEVGETGNAVGCHLHFEEWSAPGWYDGGRPSIRCRTCCAGTGQLGATSDRCRRSAATRCSETGWQHRRARRRSGELPKSNVTRRRCSAPLCRCNRRRRATMPSTIVHDEGHQICKRPRTSAARSRPTQPVTRASDRSPTYRSRPTLAAPRRGSGRHSHSIVLGGLERCRAPRGSRGGSR